MGIKVTCEECDGRFSVADEKAGRRVKCPLCGEPTHVPDDDDMPTPRRRSSGGKSNRKQQSEMNPAVVGGIAGGAVLIVGIGLFAIFGGNRQAPAPMVDNNQAVPSQVAPQPIPPANQTPMTPPTAVAAANPAAHGQMPTGAHGQSDTSGSASTTPTNVASATPAGTTPTGTTPTGTTPTGTTPMPNTAHGTTPGLASTSAPVTPTSAPGNTGATTTTAPTTASAGNVAKPADKDLDLPSLIERVEKSVIRINVKAAQGASIGSGFIVASDGTAVTNYHVMEGAKSAEAEFNTGEKFPIVGWWKLDHERDIAVIKVEAPPEKLRPVPICADMPRKGEKVVAFGAPRGLSFTASEGIVSALRTGEEMSKTKKGRLVQTTAPISGGNSGGPLVNLRGEVVGANTFKRTDGENLNFAISCLDIQECVNGKATQLGKISPSDIPEKIAKNPYEKADDLVGTEKGRLLLSQIRDVLYVALPITYDPTGRIEDYVIKTGANALERKLKWTRVTRRSDLTGSTAIVVLLMYFDIDEKNERDLVTEVKLRTEIISRDVDKDGNEVLAIVYREDAKVGTCAINALVNGIIPKSVETGTKEYFDRLVTSYRKAVKENSK